MARSERSKPDPQQVETDERFPSGPWTGFWLQRPVYPDRQWMRDLSLTFRDGKVTGFGWDVAGGFSFAGTYDLETGAVLLHKQYEQAHGVRYEGKNENDGMWLWGVWRLDRSLEMGGFHMWPKGEQDPTQRRLRAERAIEKEERVPVGVGPVVAGEDEQ